MDAAAGDTAEALRPLTADRVLTAPVEPDEQAVA
jgi:hypothetical protein